MIRLRQVTHDRRDARAIRVCAFLLLLATTAVMAKDETARDFRAMTFNVRYDTWADGGNAWRFRRAQARDLIAAADVVGIQEALDGQIRYLDKNLPDFDRVGVGRDDGKAAGEYVALYVRRSRFQIVESGTFWFSDTPDRPSIAWRAKVPRTCVWAQLKSRTAESERFYVYCVHWDHESQSAREKSATLLRQRIATATTLPLIVMGDFNAAPNAPSRMILAPKDGDLTDSWNAAKETNADGATYHAFTGKTVGSRIDALYVRNFHVRQTTIIRNANNGRYPSDHFPVSSTLRLER